MTLRLRIASFNLESLDDQTDPPLAERMDVLRPQLARLDADVLCLQEVNSRHERKGEPRTLPALDHLLEGTPWAGFHRCAGEDGSLLDRHNPVILSRWPLTRSLSHRHDLVPPPLIRLATARPPAAEAAPVGWDRPVLEAEIGLPDGRALHVFNLHLRAPLAAPVPGHPHAALSWDATAAWAEGFYLAAVKRAGQALEARLAVDAVLDREPAALIAVAGDFNAAPGHTAVRILQADPDDTGNAALANRRLIPVERGVPAERRHSVLHGGRAMLLDHLLVSDALHAHLRAVEIHNETLADEVRARRAGPPPAQSFHAPLVADFALP